LRRKNHVRNNPVLPYDSHSPAGRAVKLGYARVSTEDQSLDAQRQKLTAAGCEMMFEEKVSGARP